MVDLNLKDIGKRIRLAREKADLSQEELALKIGKKNKSSISGYENGNVEPSISDINNIATVCETTSNYLLHGETDLMINGIDDPILTNLWREEASRPELQLFLKQIADMPVSDRKEFLNALAKYYKK